MNTRPNPVTILDERRLQEYDIQRMAGVSAVGGIKE